MKRIPLTRNDYALVDDEDFERLNRYNWACAPNTHNCYYAIRTVGTRKSGTKTTLSMHRQILKTKRDVQIDHIDGNGLNNTKANLRICSTQTNAFNRPKPKVKSTSRYKGVLQRKGSSNWTARIKYNNKSIELGNYPDERIAAAVYNYAAELMFGEFARGNIGVPCLADEIKESVFRRCKAQVMKHDWHPETGAFILPESKEVAIRE